MFLAASTVSTIGPSGPAAISPQDDLLPLARAAGTGQPEALATLVMVIGGAMLRTVRRVLGSEHADVDDVTQDAVIALVTAIPGFRAECSVIHFAHRVAVLTAMAAPTFAYTQPLHRARLLGRRHRRGSSLAAGENDGWAETRHRATAPRRAARADR